MSHNIPLFNLGSKTVRTMAVQTASQDASRGPRFNIFVIICCIVSTFIVTCLALSRKGKKKTWWVVCSLSGLIAAMVSYPACRLLSAKVTVTVDHTCRICHMRSTWQKRLRRCLRVCAHFGSLSLPKGTKVLAHNTRKDYNRFV
jgi:hypothetical protein